MQSYAQLQQDLWVLEQLNQKRNGFFVEFGATDGVNLSNTYLLEKAYDWKGILCEPNPLHHKKLFNNRDCNISTMCVYPETGKMLTFLDVIDPGLSTLEKFSDADFHAHVRTNHKKINVNTITLNDLLATYNAPNKIDYMSIDTEGGEYEILCSLDWDKYDVSILTVEHNYTPSREQTYELLTSKGYKRVHEVHSQFDDWYTKL